MMQPLSVHEQSSTSGGRPPVRREKESPYEVGAVQRAFAIVEYLAGRPALTARASEIADGLGLPRPTAHRLLANLEAAGFVAQQGENGSYRLGLRLLELGHLVESELTIVGIAHPHLERLRDATGETTHLAVLEGTTVVYLDKVESDRAIRMVSRVGARLPAHITALGKAMLAYFPRVAELYDGRELDSFTGRSARTVDELLARLEEVRAAGFSVDDEEVEIGLRCIGAPVTGRSGDVVGAISLSAPTSRLPLERIAETARAVREIADAVSRDLGYRI